MWNVVEVLKGRASKVGDGLRPLSVTSMGLIGELDLFRF